MKNAQSCGRINTAQGVKKTVGYRTQPWRAEHKDSCHCRCLGQPHRVSPDTRPGQWPGRGWCVTARHLGAGCDSWQSVSVQNVTEGQTPSDTKRLRLPIITSRGAALRAQRHVRASISWLSDSEYGPGENEAMNTVTQ